MSDPKDAAAVVDEALAWILNPDESPLERFERIAAEYHRDTGYLRPGKDESAATGRDSNSEENQLRFEQWISSRLFTVVAAALSARKEPE